jgi:hypothetical protein
MSATASVAQGRRNAREVPKRLRYAAFRGRRSAPSLPCFNPEGIGNANHKKGKTHHLIPLKTAKNPNSVVNALRFKTIREVR